MGRIREVDGVYEVEPEYNGEMPSYKYSAVDVFDYHGTVLKSNNLQKLKERIKEKHWTRAWIVGSYKLQGYKNEYADVDFYYTPKYK